MKYEQLQECSRTCSCSSQQHVTLFLKHGFKGIRYMRTLLIVADMDGTHLGSKHSHLIWHRQTSYRKRINRGGGGISK